MIRLLHKEIDVEGSEELLHLPLTQESDLERLELASGEWKIEDGGLVGRFRGNGGGICYTKSSFPGDILISFYGTMIAPCRNDLNFVLKTEGWDYEKNDAARGFIGGLNGWYGQKAGFEKCPQCQTQALAFFPAEAGVEYHIQAGYCKDTLFLAVDGTLILEMRDPEPEAFADLGRIGLGTYCSQIRFRDLRVFRPAWREIHQSYTADF